MALHDEILREMMASRVLWRFKTSHLKGIPANRAGYYIVGRGEYSENAINTIPRNHSVRPDGTDPGYYVRRGRKPAFFWHGNGEYELILNHGHSLDDVSPDDEEFERVDGDGETLILANVRRTNHLPLPVTVDRDRVRQIATQEANPAAIIVRYIAEEPFQAYYRRKPIGTMRHGWGERLAAYFWPSPDRNWAVSCSALSDLSPQIQRAIGRLEACADDTIAAGELLNAFKATCVWGGVKVPESDPCVLAAEVLRVLQALSDGKVVPVDCRLNSAWTKLYAFALPDTCVIYDSRVAAAVTSILDPVMQSACGWTKWLSCLGTIPGRGGSRPRSLCWDWPNGYGV